MKNKRKIALWALFTTLITTNAGAVTVGVLAEFPNGEVYTKCLDMPENTNAYEVLQATELVIEWSELTQWGHGLCMIHNIGCPSSNCYCSSSYWGFLIAEKGNTAWNYMPVGFDGGENCWNRDYNSYDGHYCAHEGDVIGLIYGSYGDVPSFKTMGEICRKLKRNERELGFSVDSTINVGDESTMRVYDSNTNEPIRYAKVKIYVGRVGASKKIFESETDKNGEVRFTIPDEGEYNGIIASDYPHREFTIKVVKPTTTTSTTSSSTSTTTMTKTTTTPATTSTIKLEHIKISTTTSPETTTTTKRNADNENPPTGNAVKEHGNTRIYGLLAVLALTTIALLSKRK